MRKARLANALLAAALVSATGIASAASPSMDAYGPPVRVDDAASVIACCGVVDVNAVGDAVAVWAHGSPPRTIYGARRPKGGTWSAPVVLTSDYSGYPDQLALSTDGTAYFDAISRDDDGDHILAWAADGAVTDTGVGGHDDDGRVVAGVNGDVVAYSENASHAITYAFAVAGATGWTSTATIRFFGTSQVALGPHHTYYVAYTPDTGGGSPYFRVKKVDGITGDATLLVRRRLCPMGDVTSSTAPRPYDIAAARNGAAVLAWRCRFAHLQTIKALRIGVAGHVGRPVRLAQSWRTNLAAPLSPPRVAFGGRTATVVFSRAIGQHRRDILATSSSGGSHWTRPSVKVADVAAGSAAALAGRLDSVWNGAALYTYRDAGAVKTIRRPPGGTFHAPVRVFGSAASSASAAVAKDGTAFVAGVFPGVRFMTRTSAP